MPDVLLFNSVCGGTGSGFTHQMMDDLYSNYDKLETINLCLQPSIRSSFQSSLSYYNTILSFDFTLACNSMTILIDNQSISSDQEIIDIATILSTNLNGNLYTDLIPFPRQKFIVPKLKDKYKA